ncbi:hypothetical protein EO776_01910 [Halorubrum ezzemoulense]|uniref:Uncharacterized protein n=1 Tax=Halorubrum ezzemoulense TaxID=337243 RepID=A0A481RCE9_HALEZ|nr:hypothetical protein EO776_01910 [Halorubrum ezzemoulense]
MIRDVEDRGFDIEAASTVNQKREPVTHVVDERFSPRVECSTRRPAFGQRRELAFVEILFGDDPHVE